MTESYEESLMESQGCLRDGNTGDILREIPNGIPVEYFGESQEERILSGVPVGNSGEILG